MPQEGAQEWTEWGVFDPRHHDPGHAWTYGGEHNARQVASRIAGTQLARRTVRTVPDGNGGTWVHTSAWQVVEEAKP